MNFDLRQMHLIRKALAIAVLSIERHSHPLESASDQADMKGLLDRLISNDGELAFYMQSARLALGDNPKA